MADTLRWRLSDIIDRYERVARRQLPALQDLERGALIDHLPEVIDALAGWIEEGPVEGKPFTLLADGHALQRLGFGIDLETLTSEYTYLRQLLLETTVDLEDSEALRRDLIRLNRGIDHAVMEAVTQYAYQRDALRERFIGILGHDLRGPLSAISAGASALLAAEGDARQTRIAARIAGSAQRMSRMIGDILDFSRGHLGGGIPVSPTRHDLGALCRIVVDEAGAAHADRTIRFEVSGDLTATVDGDRLTQALGNLVNNALEHGDGPVEVRLHEQDDRRALVVEIINRGEPIPAALMPRLFDPFRGGARPRSAGLGLGLYIVQQVVRAHGGDISVRSDAHETRFTVTLPRYPVEKTPSRP